MTTISPLSIAFLVRPIIIIRHVTHLIIIILEDEEDAMDPRCSARHAYIDAQIDVIFVGAL